MVDFKQTVGIKPEEPEIGKKEKRAGAKKEKTEFFNQLVSVYFGFYENEFGMKPSFDGSAPRDLKSIIEAMKKVMQVEWDFDVARNSLELFLQTAINDPWLKENFLLQNLNRQKDKIFLKIKNKNNGSGTHQSVSRYSKKQTGADRLVEKLRGDIEAVQRGEDI